MTATTDPRSYAMLLGTGREEAVALVSAAAKMAGQSVVVQPSIETDVEGEAHGGARPTVIVVDLADEGALERASQARARFSFAAVPMIGVAPVLGDLTFEEALSVGMDECCPSDAPALGRLLRAVEGVQERQVERRGKTVVVADGDRGARLLAARVFHTAGYDVAFALNADETLQRVAKPDVQTVVCSTPIVEGGADGEPLWRQPAAAASQAVWVINTPPKQITKVLQKIAPEELARVDVHDAFSVPDNLLFVANELLAGDLRDARRSQRILYGTGVRFRPAGADRGVEQVGYSYNISGNGLYVRTLAPPDRGAPLWLELLPPRCDRRVHLEGIVRWARPYVPGSGATVPAGFGLELTGATETDSQRYERGYEAFVAERTQLRATAHPPGR